jgi:multiple sugar transport system ATP-binding protein
MEPLSNLDAKLRVEMRAYVAQLHRRLGKTIVYVTHDQVEAMTMGDRVAILRDGLLEQVDAPQTLYDRPASLFVAAFMGSPAMNLLRGRIVAEEDTRCVLELGGGRLPLPDSVLEARPALMGRVDEEVVVGIRPEALRPADGTRAALEGPVVLRESLGSDVLVHVEIDAPAVRAGEQLEAAARSTARPRSERGSRLGWNRRCRPRPARRCG